MPFRRLLLAILFAGLTGVASRAQAQPTKDVDPFHPIRTNLDKNFGDTKWMTGFSNTQRDEVTATVEKVKKNLAFLEKFAGGKSTTVPAGYSESMKSNLAILKVASHPDTSPEASVKLYKAVADDLDIKAAFAKANAQNVFALVSVTVQTLDGVTEKPGYEVYCVPIGLENERSWHETFDKLSSPTTKKLAPGCYLMWCRKEKSVSRSKIVNIGADGKLEQTVDLFVAVVK
jgi:hypothetical protein